MKAEGRKLIALSLPPLLLAACLEAWILSAGLPRLREARRACAPLEAAEAGVKARLSPLSDLSAADSLASARAVAARFLPSPAEAPAALARISFAAEGRGWSVTFGPAHADRSPNAQIGLLDFPARLRSTAADGRSFSNLIALLRDLETDSPRIGLTRLAVRAEERGGYAAEAELRLAYRNAQ